MGETRGWPWLDAAEDEERIVRFTPAFHRCADPKGNYGIGSVRMVWALKVGDWAVTWDVHTDWGLPKEAFLAATPDGCDNIYHRDGYPRHGQALAGAVDFHSPVPQWDDQEPSQAQCSVTGTVCYLDSGFLLGDQVFDTLRIEGDEATWRKLRGLLDEMRSQAAEVSSS